MKLLFKLFLFLLTLVLLGDKSLSLTNYKIKIICRKTERESTCIKNLKERKYNLQKGNKIEIPVIPYKK